MRRESARVRELIFGDGDTNGDIDDSDADDDYINDDDVSNGDGDVEFVVHSNMNSNSIASKESTTIVIDLTGED
jgi:hypothetical protein